MSQVKREIIECPNCHRKGEFELYECKLTLYTERR